MKTWDIILDSRLIDVYELDEASLQLNRNGRMTDKQRQRLGMIRCHKIGRFSVVAIFAFFLWISSGYLLISGILAVFVSILRVILCLIFLIQSGQIVYQYRRIGREISAGKVRMYPGRLNKVVWYGIRILFCERGTFYNLPNREWDAFEHYGRYRVYCTPHTHIILAAQPVHRDEPLPEAWGRRDDRF